ncbi:conserved Plasmodium protein, unknown function [Plasmodium ovale wallikeri]|uniref:Uncharacterized protein n=1 Tax=Plasmodium ovale wallikeri TaxID=864142 RepID=A0A1A8Z573_PLAOA|nr:conserved Plasmodium protein, unknown function [Plasmodium ovale wallikeri]
MNCVKIVLRKNCRWAVKKLSAFPIGTNGRYSISGSNAGRRDMSTGVKEEKQRDANTEAKMGSNMPKAVRIPIMRFFYGVIFLMAAVPICQSLYETDKYYKEVIREREGAVATAVVATAVVATAAVATAVVATAAVATAVVATAAVATAAVATTTVAFAILYNHTCEHPCTCEHFGTSSRRRGVKGGCYPDVFTKTPNSFTSPFPAL